MRLEVRGAVFRVDAVHVNRAVAALSRDVLVERVPRDALDVVRVFRDLAYALAVSGREDACGVVCATCDDIFTRGAPCKVVDLHCCASERRSRLPIFLFVGEFVWVLPEGGCRRSVGGGPDNDHAV